MRIRDNRRWGSLATLLLACTFAGCGGGGVQQTAQVAAPEPSRPPLPPAADEPPLEGQQFGIVDEPTSGQASERPKMNAAAARAYASGMTAFRRQDLAQARAGFTQATQADPRA